MTAPLTSAENAAEKHGERWQPRHIVPNLVTMLVSLSGLAAIYIAVVHQDRRAALCLLIAGALDAVDGVIARKLNAQSRFGNVYDSMSDLVAFGVAPAVALFFVDLLHPAVAAVYILAIQFRLTRYSAYPEAEGRDRWFRGIASPDAVYMAILVGAPLGENYDIGFAIFACLAVYPGRLWPKGLRLVKFAVACVAFWLFLNP